MNHSEFILFSESRWNACSSASSYSCRKAIQKWTRKRRSGISNRKVSCSLLHELDILLQRVWGLLIWKGCFVWSCGWSMFLENIKMRYWGLFLRKFYLWCWKSHNNQESNDQKVIVVALICTYTIKVIFVSYIPGEVWNFHSNNMFFD